MDCAPLNLAHFHERRGDKLIKRHRYEEALKAIETSLLYVEDACKLVKTSKALEVLETQKREYERKLNQINMRKLQYDKFKSKEIVPTAQNEVTSYMKKEPVNAQSIARSIDKTIKDFNDKYGSTLLETKQREVTTKENYDNGTTNMVKEAQLSDNSKETNIEANIRRLSLIDEHMQTADEELPSLAPLELPSFDYNVFGI